jgi:formate hydrogenlyase subunit 4
MRNIAYVVIQSAVILLLAPLVSGIINKIKALTQKRKGAPIFQMYFDLFKLLRKTSVVSDVSSWIFRATPYVVFSTALAAALLVPVSAKLMPAEIPGDIIMFVSILALGRFFMMLAGLDTASTFGGMGSSREAMISSLIEPSIIVSLLTIGLISSSTSMPQIISAMESAGSPLGAPVYILIFLALLIIVIAETARIPVDDPSTHLELTMVHEAMILEYSGRQLAFMEYGSAIKQLTLITLVADIVLPLDQLIVVPGVGAIVLSLIVYLVKVLVLTVVIGLIEVNTVKFRIFSVPNLAALSFVLSILGFLSYFVLGGGHV